MYLLTKCALDEARKLSDAMKLVEEYGINADDIYRKLDDMPRAMLDFYSEYGEDPFTEEEAEDATQDPDIEELINDGYIKKSKEDIHDSRPDVNHIY